MSCNKCGSPECCDFNEGLSETIAQQAEQLEAQDRELALYHDGGLVAGVTDTELRLAAKRLEALRTAAERQLTLLACAGVEKLTELAPDMGWDSGESVAAGHIALLPQQDGPAARCVHKKCMNYTNLIGGRCSYHQLSNKENNDGV